MSASIEIALRQIFERLGGIDAELKAGRGRHDDFKIGIAGLGVQIAAFSERITKVESDTERIPVIETALWTLEGKRLERQGAVKLVTGMFKTSHALVGVAGAGIVWLAHHVWPWPLPWK